MSLDWFWKRNDKTDEKIEFANKLIKKIEEIKNGQKL